LALLLDRGTRPRIRSARLLAGASSCVVQSLRFALPLLVQTEVRSIGPLPVPFRNCGLMLQLSEESAPPSHRVQSSELALE
jgi:hypothetical protein